MLRPNGANFSIRRKFAARFRSNRGVEVGVLIRRQLIRLLLIPSELQKYTSKLVLPRVGQPGDGRNSLIQ